MRILITTFITIFLLFSCSFPDAKELTHEEKLAIQKKRNDSLMIIFDSLMGIKVEVPPLIDSSLFSAKCVNDFNKLARETDGGLKILANAKLVSETVIEIINNNAADNSDLMILIDKTGSMEDDIDDIKKSLNQILGTISRFNDIRLAVGTYGDKNVDGDLWYDFKNFENDYQQTSKFINDIKLTHGGDYPESVYDGIYEAFQENFWKSDSKRIVVLIGDAPSLDSTLTEHDIDDIISIAKRDKINMNFYPIVLSPYNEESVPGITTVTRMEKKNFIENIYPVPSNGSLSVDLNVDSPLTLEIIDQKGVILKSIVTSNSTERIDLYDLPNGIYIVRAFDGYKNFDDRKVILNK